MKKIIPDRTKSESREKTYIRGCTLGVITALLLSAVLLGGCEAKSEGQENNTGKNTEEKDMPALPDGVYTAEFQTDSSMFHVSEACGGKGTLTVEDGNMTIHISLGSKKILNLYPGLAEDAGKEGAKLLMPTEDTVTYSDGTTEEVYGFDVPVPALDTEFDLALIGTKGKWYDHKVCVSDPEPSDGSEPMEKGGQTAGPDSGTVEEGGQASDGGADRRYLHDRDYV